MKIRKKYLFYVIIFTSAVFGAINSGVDATVSSLYVTDPFALGLATFIFGVPVSLFFGILFSLKLGGKSLGSKVADPNFERLRLVKKKELKYQLLSAFGNASYTMGYYVLFVLLNDPSVVIPYTQVVILYLVAIESINEKDMPTLSELESIIIVTFGAILGSISFSGGLNLESLAVVFLVINPAWVIFAVYQRKLKWLKINGKINDSINIRLWNVVFSCVITAVMILIYDSLMGTNHFLRGIYESMKNFFWVLLIALGAFFSLVFYIRGLGIGKASVAQAVKSTTIIFSIPVTLLIAHLGIIEPFPMDPTSLVIKSIGITIMILGITSFALNLVKAYIFIRIKPGYLIEEIMDEIWKIRGVTHVSATAGKYDIIVKIRIRTLVKGYENIIRKIESVKGIRNYKWQSVLKEWDTV